MTQTIVTLDLGATKCAAGIIKHNNDNLSCIEDCNIKLVDTDSLEDLISQIEDNLGIKFKDADAICVGAAGQYNGQELCHLENVYPYPMPFAKLAKEHQWPIYAVIHDYETVVCATFTSYMNDPNNIMCLNTCKPDTHKRRVALGLGTGLGLKDGVQLMNGDIWLGKNEIGHIGIVTPPAASAFELSRHHELMKFMRNQDSMASHQPVTFENILTGRGIEYMYRFLFNDSLPAGQIGNKLAAGKTPALMDMFAWYLGLFIGTVQLIFMPEGGIWVTGGVAINNLGVFENKNLHTGINTSPAYQKERQAHPLGVLKNPKHALIGGGFYATRRLLNL